MGDRVSTGIPELDRKLDGGIPQGHVVLFRAPPASQSELLLSRLACRNDSLYLTTERPEVSVRKSIRCKRSDGGNVSVFAVDRSEPLPDVSRCLRSDELPDVVIVDRTNDLERLDADRYRALLATLQQRATETETVVVLHGVEGERLPPERDRTAYAADVVIELVPEFDGNRLSNRLAVPKFRGGSALSEPLTLELTGRIFVDNSRDIA